MKSGASDPFADVEEPDDEEDDPPADEAGEGETDEPESETSAAADDAAEAPADGEVTTSADDGDVTPTDDGERAAETGRVAAGTPAARPDAAEADDLSREELPLVIRREKVKDERPEVHQLFVQSSTHGRAVDAERALEDRFEEDLSRLDAREAIYLAGMENLDAAERRLRRWGYDL